MENILTEHSLVAEDPRRAKLADFGPSSLDIEVFAYIEVADYNESLAVRQDLLMQIFERIEKAGLSIAYPTQTLYLRSGASERDLPRTSSRWPLIPPVPLHDSERNRLSSD
ncbi:hypothetical protein [Aurantiacibacter hainanensis]|uniref:hypothetical protein n=1 Tax=Aurantiacibacter hainanensis TaxID=3076114 RepID=UPI0030C6C08A